MPNLPRVVSREPLPHDEAKWTKLVKVTYEDADGKSRIWESAERTTWPPATAENPDVVDGVDIVAIIRGTPGAPDPRIVLIKQFRPAVGCTVIELPAGLVDAGESVDEAAVRELREETGYVGRVSADTEASLSPSLTLYADPGFGNNNLQIVYVDVDGADAHNRDGNRRPQLEEGELVQAVFPVPLTDLFVTCRRLANEGYAIDARVGTLAEGMEMARRYLRLK
ncbi:ADP-ribose pyrophosphatase [Sporothrix schenckii 1099-18]|uniref:ADP-ribose pyrophosphatase n=1 Tax=Sporothrix schenckii 1099-18 TaxID=1397361 RepID=A0A0F2MAP1_SPOSC|nr:ADP-ribose pyrophosphatase [Sporothrix schenckii 1099-18]KJR86144.1 ADP-ribose pyrophosphatase [Sporothrix schenckii 1099-18]